MSLTDKRFHGWDRADEKSLGSRNSIAALLFMNGRLRYDMTLGYLSYTCILSYLGLVAVLLTYVYLSLNLPVHYDDIGLASNSIISEPQSRAQQSVLLNVRVSSVLNIHNIFSIDISGSFKPLAVTSKRARSG